MTLTGSQSLLFVVGIHVDKVVMVVGIFSGHDNNAIFRMTKLLVGD